MLGSLERTIFWSKQQVSDFKPLLIRASAGTGKTFQLSNRYIALLAAGAPAEEILATTFTRKAAHEIMERIFKRLAEAADSEKAASELAEHIQNSSFTSERAKEILFELVRSQHRLRISTLDSFFIGLTRAFAFEVGLDKNWRVLDEPKSEELRVKSIQYLCENLASDEVLQLLRLISKRGVKRAVHRSISQIVEDLYELYRESRAENWSWLKPPSPPEKGVKETIDRLLIEIEIPKTKKGDPDKRWLKALTQTQELYRAKEWEALLAKGLCNAVLTEKNKYYNTEMSSEFLTLCDSMIQCAAYELLTFLRNQSLALYHILTLYHGAFEEHQKASGGLRFSDVKYILKNAAFSGALEEVFYRLDSRISHLLLDEFQDTSLEEWTILEPYVAEILSKAEHDYTFFCVGDVKQSIYGWRGGVAEIFDTLTTSWENLEPRSMDVSYRSSPEVIDTVNKIFTSIISSSDLPMTLKEKWEHYFNVHQTANTNLRGYVAVEEIEEFVDEEGNPSSYLRTVKKIKEIYLQNKEISIGVLVRRNADISRLIYLLCREEIPASEEGGNPLTDSQAVIVLLNLLRVLEHPGDTIAYYQVAHSRLADVCGLNAPPGEREMLIQVDKLRAELFEHGYGPFLRAQTNGLLETLPARDRRRVLQLIELGFGYDESGGDRISGFLKYVQRTKVEDPESKNIRVMTVHKSKGLEFDVVFLPGLNRSIKPLTQAVLVERSSPVAPPEKITPYPSEVVRLLQKDLERMKEKDVLQNFQEELCVLYVALTRAKKALYMYVPDSNSLKSPSPASLIREALAPQSEGGGRILYELGNEAEALENKADSEQEAPNKKLVLPAHIKVLTTEQRNRMLSRKTPSKLEGGGAVILKDLFQEKRSAAAERGTVIHYLFEQIDWLGEEPPEKEALSEQLRESNLVSRENVDKYIDQFLEMTRKPNVSDLLKRERYNAAADSVQVRQEFPFLYRDVDSLVKGIIDRFVYTKDGDSITQAEVIDFKTDTVKDFSESVEFYRPQLETYREAISRSVRIDPASIRLTLAFVTHDKIIEVN